MITALMSLTGQVMRARVNAAMLTLFAQDADSRSEHFEALCLLRLSKQILHSAPPSIQRLSNCPRYDTVITAWAVHMHCYFRYMQ